MTLGESFPQVVHAARCGEHWAISVLYEDLHPQVLAYLKSRKTSEAEDLAHDTWIDVGRSLARFHGDEADFHRLVFTIARRRLIDHRRRESRRKTAPSTDDVLERHGQTGDAEVEALDILSAEAARALIGTLPPDQADVVLLRVIGGFSSEEVGDHGQDAGDGPGSPASRAPASCRKSLR